MKNVKKLISLQVNAEEYKELNKRAKDEGFKQGEYIREALAFYMRRPIPNAYFTNEGHFKIIYTYGYFDGPGNTNEIDIGYDEFHHHRQVIEKDENGKYVMYMGKKFYLKDLVFIAK